MDASLEHHQSVEVATFQTEAECRAGARIAALALDAAEVGLLITGHDDPVQVILEQPIMYALRCEFAVAQQAK